MQSGAFVGFKVGREIIKINFDSHGQELKCYTAIVETNRAS